ncbi:MAG: vWA domain-containing protein [Candidatus Nanohaloarchaea archaeon]
MLRAFLLGVFLVFVLSPAAAQSADIIDSSIEDRKGGQDGFVLGRPAKSTFEYRINDPYQPIDTALAIDESGSMGGVMDDAKNGAKNYVENTRTSDGDENAVISFEDSAYTRQSLTTDKDKAKDAIDSISDDGSTDLPAGVEKAHDELKNGDNDIQVMIVLADGGGGDPGTEADAARSDGIEVHGIMYGSGASTSEFESMTDSDDCTTDSSENNDDDTCWYAESGTIDEVYNAIQEEVEEETDVDLRLRLRDMAYTDDSYDSYSDLGGPNEEYVRSFQDVEAGEKTGSIEWYPTDFGNFDLLTGDSILEVTTDDGTSQYDFSNSFNTDVGYVDFELTDFTVERDDSQVRAEAEVTNTGDVDSLGTSEASSTRELWLKDSSSHVSADIPEVPAGDSKNISLNVGNSNSLVDGNGIEELYLHADPTGYWDSVDSSSIAVGGGEGEVLEPNEDDNEASVGYPPRVNALNFDDISGQHAFSIEASVDMLTDGSDFGECRLKFTNLENGEEFPSNGRVQGSLTEEDSDTATCRYDNFNSSVTGFEPTDNVEVNITAENRQGGTGWNADNHRIPNEPPEIVRMEPRNDEPILDRDVELLIEVDDPEGDDIEHVRFNDSVENEIIEDRPNPPQQNTFIVEWEDLDLGEYEWEAFVKDKWGSSERTASFERVVSRIYRTQSRIEHEYSSLIIDEGGQGSFFFEADVDTDNRTVTTYLESSDLDAEFVDSGLSQETYEVDTGDPDRFQIQVSGDNPGKHELKIITEDDTVDTNTTETFPVYVRSAEAEGREVPGLSQAYILAAAFLSSVLYFALL